MAGRWMMPEKREIVLEARVEDISKAVEFIGRAMAAFGVSQSQTAAAHPAGYSLKIKPWEPSWLLKRLAPTMMWMNGQSACL
jgi:hypothetical protein